MNDPPIQHASRVSGLAGRQPSHYFDRENNKVKRARETEEDDEK